ncbi:MAG: hypothetical protein ACI9KE_005390 [Polyangiales bacterium]|jgi:hypothetical protein
MSTTDAAEPIILPLVGSLADIEFAKISAQSGGPPPPAHIRLGSYLSLVYVQLDGAGGLLEASVTTFDSDALDVAAAALRAYRPAEFECVAPGTYCSSIGDGFDSSRILLTDEIRALELKGAPVAAVPHRDALWITGSEDVDGLRRVLEGARTAFESFPTSARPLCLGEDGWTPFRLAKDHPLYTELCDLTYRELHSLYDTQRNLLMEQMENSGAQTYVTPYDVAEDERGELVSYCTWTGVASADGIASDLLLPLTDKMQIILVEDQQPKSLVPLTDFARFRSVCGSVLEETTHSPPRLRTLGFPTPQMIQELGGAQQ